MTKGTTQMEEKTTDTGIQHVCWFDRISNPCSLMQSQLTDNWQRRDQAKSFLWLGTTGTGNHNQVVIGSRMLIDREEAIELARRLNCWANTGSIFLPKEEGPWTESTIQFAAGYEIMPEE